MNALSGAKVDVKSFESPVKFTFYIMHYLQCLRMGHAYIYDLKQLHYKVADGYECNTVQRIGRENEPKLAGSYSGYSRSYTVTNRLRRMYFDLNEIGLGKEDIAL